MHSYTASVIQTEPARRTLFQAPFRPCLFNQSATLFPRPSSTPSTSLSRIAPSTRYALPSTIPETEFQNTCKAYKEDFYLGIFKVHPAALYHDFYVAIGSHVVSPIEIWELMRSPQRRVRGDLERRHEIEGFRSSS
jgi:hypothetical protein